MSGEPMTETSARIADTFHHHPLLAGIAPTNHELSNLKTSTKSPALCPLAVWFAPRNLCP